MVHLTKMHRIYLKLIYPIGPRCIQVKGKFNIRINKLPVSATRVQCYKTFYVLNL